MMMAAKYHFALGHGYGNAGLREITGNEEQQINVNNSVVALQLLECLIVPDPLANFASDDLLAMPLSVRDQLLTGVYQDTFGSEIQSEVLCPACQQPFELELGLTALQQQLLGLATEASNQLAEKLSANEDKTYTLDGRIRFRLPNGHDEVRCMQRGRDKSSQQLIDNCIVYSEGPVDWKEIENIIERIAPTVDAELRAACPHCGEESFRHFHIQQFLLAHIQAQRPLLRQQIHLLAMHYGWSLDQILSLGREDRLVYCQLIQQELE